MPKVPDYRTFLNKFKGIMPDHMPHDTRHTFISMMTETGIDKRIIQSIVGHARKTDVTDRYTHINLDVKLEAVNKIV